MEKFLTVPNLPETKVTMAAVSSPKPDVITELVNNYRIRTISPLPLDSISGSERYHADMSILHLGGSRFVIDDNNSELASKLGSMGAEIKLCSGIDAAFPLLNICILGKKAICDPSRVDKYVMDYFLREKIRIIKTRQRYSKCSTAVISENAVITTDNSICKLCRAENIDVLKVSCDGIRLDGYDHGFIGGTCGMVDAQTLVFCGDIKRHKDYYNIRSFAANHGISITSAGGGDLYDIGGILPVFEE